MRICIVGSGYVGLVTGTCFAEFGHEVICVDKDEKKVENLKMGKVPIYEPGLDKLVKKNVKAGRLFFTTSLGPAAAKCDAVFIAVGTPSSRRGDGYADLSYVYAVAEEIAPHLKKYKVIVNKSTVPVGTAEQVQRIIREKNPKAKFDVASNPEFLKEGAAINDFMYPDRVVIGVESKKAEGVLKKIYQPLSDKNTPVFITDIPSAELIKYASNAFLATKISFINEIANLCEKVGANVSDVSLGMGLDTRIGPDFLRPGPGYGGSCFPKDVTALLRIAQEHETPLRILESVFEVNIAQKAKMVKKIQNSLFASTKAKEPAVMVLGLTFKPETDDMREASSLTILPGLIEKGIKVYAHDPQGMEEAKKLLPPDVVLIDDIYKTAKKVDAVVLMTDWEEYRELDLKRLKKSMKSPIFIDLRNVYCVSDMGKAGFKYFSIGR